jgi:hypothetical protein
MTLKNMAVQNNDDEVAEMQNNPYGYGLCIRLNPKQCEVLGITTPPEAGTVLSLRAMATATAVTQEADVGEDDKEVYLELQITDLEIGTASNAAKSASMLYGADTD